MARSGKIFVMSTDASGDQFAHIARVLSKEPDVSATLREATATALQILPNCHHAGISLVGRHGAIVTVAQTDDVVVRADELQLEAGEGPSLQAIAEQETVYVNDLTSEQRWPVWAFKAAEELKIRSVLALQLFVGPDVMGSLTLYSDVPDAFEADDRVSALALAAHVAVAVSSARRVANMESALASRTVIGQAQGMLMQRLDITADQAFSALVRISQTNNIRLNAVADDIVNNGVRAELLD
jgi:transcriptional regulator with GAF, ATPase, and Fis domain